MAAICESFFTGLVLASALSTAKSFRNLTWEDRERDKVSFLLSFGDHVTLLRNFLIYFGSSRKLLAFYCFLAYSLSNSLDLKCTQMSYNMLKG